MTELKALVYVSSATELFSEQALDELLQGARRKNERIGVTGVLLHCEGNFMQYVEGPPQAIDRLYERIRADDRHHSIVTIHEEPLDARQFAGWSMAYAPTQAADFARLSSASRVGSAGTVGATPALDAGRLLGDFWAQHRHGSAKRFLG